MIFLAMKWCMEYSEEMYGEKKTVQEKQIEKKPENGQW